MAISTATSYANLVKSNQKVLYAVWEPSFPIKLGDYGYMNGNIFVHMGNISQIPELKGVNMAIRKNNANDDKFFTSGEGVEFSLTPKAVANTGKISAKASISINFTKEDAVFFNAAGCRYEVFEHKYEIGQQILKVHKKNSDTWKREFVLVTDRVIAKRSLILVSTSSDFQVTLEANAKIPVIDLAKANLGLSEKSVKSGGYKVITEKPLTLLIGLCKVQRPFPYIRKAFKPFLEYASNFMLHSITNLDYFEYEDISEELYFGQITEDLSL